MRFRFEPARSSTKTETPLPWNCNEQSDQMLMFRDNSRHLIGGRVRSRAADLFLSAFTSMSFAAILFAPFSWAQAAEDDPFAGIEEMVVVGTTSASLLQSQEVSVVGFDADYLEALGASDLSDISQFTPNLEIRTPFAASNPSLFIRGVGLRDFNANSSSSVAVYNDDIYMNSPAAQLSQLFDVSNLDVLRGPQGGIYGRNASAGAIRVLSRKPTGTPGGYVSATYGRFMQIDVEGATEAVLVPDMLSMRIAGKMSRRGGTTKNRCGDPEYKSPVPGETSTSSFVQRVHVQCYNATTKSPSAFGGQDWVVGTKAPVKDRVNDVNNWATRALLRFELDVLDGLDVLVNFHGGQNRGDARQFQLVGARQAGSAKEPGINTPIATRDASGYADPDNQFNDQGIPGGPLNGIIRDPYGGEPFKGDYNNVEKEKLDLFGSSISATLVSGNWTNKLIVGYEWNKREVDLNLDGNPYKALEPLLANRSWQVTGEGRVGWDGSEGLSFQLAGMFLYESLEVDNEFELSFLDVRLQSYEMRTRYYAVYGELDWEPSETLAVHIGGRFNHENKELILSGSSVNRLVQRINPTSPNVTNFVQDEKSEAKEPGVAWDITFSYLPTDDVTFYAKYARGWKGPHINGLVLSPASVAGGDSLTTPVDPEQVDSMEVGLKSLWWDARARLNFAFFYYDYNDIQVFRLRNTAGGVPVNQLINADDADIIGVEFDIDLRPFEGLGPPILDGFNLFLSFAWLESSYTDFVNVIKSSPGGVPPVTVTTTIDFSGAQLVNSPEFSFIGYAQWVLPTDYGTFVPRFDWSFKDDVFFSPENSELVGQSALWIMNLRLSYQMPGENIEISGWVENLTDQTYTLDVFNLARFRGSILYAIGDPRTYGVTMKVSF